MKKIFAHFSIFLFLLYLLWYAEAFNTVALFLYGGTGLVIFATACYINGRTWREFPLPSGIQWWMLFGIYALISGIIVAADRGMLISSLVTYFAFLLVLICIVLIIRGEKSTGWLLRQLVCVSIICALYTVFRGVDYYNGVMVRTMSAHNNPNTLGVLMIFGTFSILYISQPRMKDLLISMAPLSLFLYIIILTGSKKALLIDGVLLCIWVIGLFKGLSQSKRILDMICAYILVAVCVAGLITYFLSSYVNTASFARMQTMASSGSTSMRSGMYREAWEMFKSNPVFGVGYSQFRVLSQYGTYAHATYAELPADTGIFGTILFMCPIVITGRKLLRRINSASKYRRYTLTSLYIAELLLGAVNIFFYEFMHLLMWTFLFIEEGYSKSNK